MAKLSKLTKGQASKNVRRILLKYQIDLNYLHFSASGASIYLSGYLVKNSGFELSNEEIIVLTQELSAIGPIKSDLENWFLSSDQIYYLGDQEQELDIDFFTDDDLAA
jgi:hypothetical protein